MSAMFVVARAPVGKCALVCVCVCVCVCVGMCEFARARALDLANTRDECFFGGVFASRLNVS